MEESFGAAGLIDKENDGLCGPAKSEEDQAPENTVSSRPSYTQTYRIRLGIWN